jgi:phosphate transport system substrate-binding protein
MGNKGMVAQCAQVAGCVAYIGISYLSSALSNGLGEAALANTAGQYLLPDAASIDAAVASFVPMTPPNETISMIDGPAAAGYPIVNYEYAVVSARQPSAAKAQALRAFLDWAVTSGSAAAYLGPVRFRPLPPDAVSLSEAQIAKISFTGGN